MFSKFEKITKVRLPFDRRHENPKKNYGIGGLEIYFILKGPRGATQFAATFMNCQLPHVHREFKEKDFSFRGDMGGIMGTDVGYHAMEPQYEGQQPTKDCEVCKPCYYDGSSMWAADWVMDIFSVKGEAPENRLWQKLRDDYVGRFGEPK